MKIVVRNQQKKIALSPQKIKAVARKALTLERRKKTGEITISFLTDPQIRELNLLYRGQYNPTDVLSFDISKDKKEILADIAISTDTAIRQARNFKTSTLFELYLYVVHGILHILGYDDETKSERKIMEEKTKRILLSCKLL